MKYYRNTFLLFLLIAFGLTLESNAQWIKIDTNGGKPDPTVALEINSKNRGVLFPRMTTTEMSSINSPRHGLTMFNTDSVELMSYDSVGGSWILTGTKAAKGFSNWNKNITGISYYNTSAQSVAIGQVLPSGASILEVASPTGNTKEIAFLVNHSNSSGKAKGIENLVTGTSTGERKGIENAVTMTNASSADVYGIDNYVTSSSSSSTGNTYAFKSKTASLSTGTNYGLHITGVEENLLEGRLTIGSTTANNGFATFHSPKSNDYSYGIEVENNYTGTSSKRGVQVSVSKEGSGSKLGTYINVTGNSSQSNPIYGNYVNMTPSKSEVAYASYNSIPALAPGFTGARYGVYNSVNGNAIQTGTLYGVYNDITPKNSETSYGIYNDVSNSGSGVRYGTYSNIKTGTTSKSFGSFVNIDHTSSSPANGFELKFSGNGSGARKGLLIDIGVSGTGTNHGIYVDNEDYNYFSSKVGIGTTSPSAHFHVYESGGGADVTIESGTSSNARLYFKNSAETWYLGNINNEFRVINGSDLFTIEPNGKVGIGNVNPSEKLDVEGSVQVDSAFVYESAQTRYLSVSSAAFSLANAGSSVSIGGFTSGNSRWVDGGTITNAANMYAPVSLPDGASISEVTFYVYDNNATYEVQGFLKRHSLGGSVVSIMATTNTSGTTAIPGNTSLTDTTISGTIDNENYSYYLQFLTREGINGLRIYGARIKYTVTEAR